MLRLMVKEPNVSPDELEQIAVPTLVIAGKTGYDKRTSYKAHCQIHTKE